MKYFKISKIKMREIDIESRRGQDLEDDYDQDKGYKKIALGLQKPCTWEGIEYPSITAAAKALGVLVPTLWKWLQKGYTSFADRGNNE